MSFSLIWNNPNTIKWTVLDATGAPVVGATVVGKLYAGRSQFTPDTIPGTLVTGMSSLSLADQGAGLYMVSVAANVIPAIGNNYVLVIEASQSSVLIRHWEEPTSVVAENEKTLNADLCSLEDAKAWLSVTDTASDVLLRRLITACSQDFLNKTRRTDLTPAKDWTDRLFTNRDYWWRGLYPSAVGDALHDPLHGRHEIYLKHYPVNSVASLVANGTALDLVSDPTDLTVAGGYWFDDSRIGEDRQKIYLIGYVFPAFLNAWDVLPNLVINYNAGYDSIPSDIQQAVIEWVSIRRGQSQLQAVNQSATGFKIGDYEQSNPISPLTLGVLESELPTSIQRVIDYYTRPVSF